MHVNLMQFNVEVLSIFNIIYVVRNATFKNSQCSDIYRGLESYIRGPVSSHVVMPRYITPATVAIYGMGCSP